MKRLKQIVYYIAGSFFLLIIFLSLQIKPAYAANGVLSGNTGVIHVDANQIYTGTVTFPDGGFTSTPNVVVATSYWNSSNPVAGGAWVSAKSPTGFTYKIYGNATVGGDISIDWSATAGDLGLYIKSGTTGILHVNTGQIYTATITFPSGGFTTTPNVVVSTSYWNGGNPVASVPWVVSKTPASFTYAIYGNATTGGDFSIDWVASLGDVGSFIKGGTIGPYHVNADQIYTSTVTFSDGGFTSTPNVVVATSYWNSSNPVAGGAWVSSKSPTGFTYKIYGNATVGGDISIDWSASTPGNNAACQSISPPLAPVYMGSSYAAQVQMRNTGSTIWTTSSNYHLGSQDPQDNLVWGYNRASLSNGDTVPGGIGMFNFSVIAPLTPGTYNFNWQTVQDGGVGWFGQKCTTTVNVVQLAPLSVTCRGDPNPVAINDQVTWSAQPNGGAAPYFYFWSGADGLLSSSSTVYKTYTTPGIKNATVTVTDSMGDLNTASCSISVSTTDCPALPPAPDINSFTPPSGSASSADQIDFSWSPVPGATGGYYYARSPSVPGACTDAGAYCPNKSQYIPPLTTYRSQLQLGTTYSWWVNSALNNPPAGCPDKGPDSEHATLHICSDSSAPTGLNPSGGGTISEGLSSITWNRSSDINVTHYYLRVDEDPQTPSDFNPAICPTNPSYNYGDVCTGLLPVGSLCDATTCSYDYNFRAGHSYTYWVHEVVDGDPLCFGDAAAPTSPFTATAPTPTPGPWMRINGDVHSNEDIRLPFKQ